MNAQERARLDEHATPLVSIVVPARNEHDHVEACLSSLLAQTYPPNRLEVIIADGQSTDGTREIVERLAVQDDRVKVLDNPGRTTPLGFNLGIRAARGDIIGVMSAHAVPDRAYVQLAVHALTKTNAWAVGGRISRAGATPVQAAIARATSSPFGVGNTPHNYARLPQAVETVFPGMWRRDVFAVVGLFDPELVRNQDDELSYRIRESGGQIWYDPAIVVDYTPRGSFRRLFTQYRQYGMWKVRVFQKHPRAVRWRQLVPPIWLLCMFVGFGLGLTVSPIFLGGTALVIAAYVALMTTAAWQLRGEGVSTRLVLVALVVLHVAYGVGLLQGLARFFPRWFVNRKGAVPTLEEPMTAPATSPSGALGP